MTLTMFVFFFQSIVGCIGTCIVMPSPGVIPPSTKNIDHPSRPWRIFYRVMAICMCNMGASLMMMIPLAELHEDLVSNGLSDVTRALLGPANTLAPRLFAKAARKRARDSR